MPGAPPKVGRAAGAALPHRYPHELWAASASASPGRFRRLGPGWPSNRLAAGRADPRPSTSQIQAEDPEPADGPARGAPATLCLRSPRPRRGRPDGRPRAWLIEARVSEGRGAVLDEAARPHRRRALAQAPIAMQRASFLWTVRQARVRPSNCHRRCAQDPGRDRSRRRAGISIRSVVSAGGDGRQRLGSGARGSGQRHRDGGARCRPDHDRPRSTRRVAGRAGAVGLPDACQGASRSGSTPMPIRLERWMRSKPVASTARIPSSAAPLAAQSRDDPTP